MLQDKLHVRFVLLQSRSWASETQARMKIAPREKGETAIHFNSKSCKKLSKNVLSRPWIN